MLLPAWNDYDPVLHAFLACGEVKTAEALRELRPGATVAIDIETPGVSDPFTIKCVTAAWHIEGGMVQSVILDPLRNSHDRFAVRSIMERAGELVLHNSSFDIPGLVATGLMKLPEIAKVSDTIVYARMAYPDTLVKKDLASLSTRLLRMGELAGGMDRAFAAAGYKSRAQGFASMDIDSPIYRFGAMADTVCTLRLLDLIREEAVARLLNHPFDKYGHTTGEDAKAEVEKQQQVNRIMLRRSAKGLAVDMEYLDAFRERVAGECERAEALLSGSGVRPGNGNDLMAAIDRMGDLPLGWPRTPTGRLKSDKANLEALEHPLAQAHRAVAHSSKVLGYLEKVVARSRYTGRLHPQVNVLGASATGRMAYGEPELQQFPEEARPIIVCDGQGLTSLDWSQIEPVTLANMAHDTGFLAPFEGGADLYEPIQRAAGIERKTAKVVLLATMYGQGEAKLARTIGQSPEAASQIKRQMLAAMPESAKLMGKISQVAATYGIVITVGGRILTVPQFDGEYVAYRGVNYTVQGSAYDILAETILEAERRGLGQYIQLAMHDELVVDTPAAAEIEEIMRTPPKSLIRWAERVPVLRTDRADLGHTWLAA